MDCYNKKSIQHVKTECFFVVLKEVQKFVKRRHKDVNGSKLRKVHWIKCKKANNNGAFSGVFVVCREVGSQNI